MLALSRHILGKDGKLIRSLTARVGQVSLSPLPLPPSPQFLLPSHLKLHPSPPLANNQPMCTDLHVLFTIMHTNLTFGAFPPFLNPPGGTTFCDTISNGDVSCRHKQYNLDLRLPKQLPQLSFMCINKKRVEADFSIARRVHPHSPSHLSRINPR